MSVIVTGAVGQLGRELCRQLGSAAVAADLPTLDITDPQQVQELLARVQPEAVINCAAYTLVDRAETEAEVCAA